MYLDDLLQAERTRLLCEQALSVSYNLLLLLGFLPNHNKSVYIPPQCIESLGHVTDSQLMKITLPTSTAEAIVHLCLITISNPVMTIRRLCIVIGKLISCFMVTPLGGLHYRTMERLKVSALRLNKGDFEAIIVLDQSCLNDLHWWCQTLPTTATPIDRGCVTAVFTTDASRGSKSKIGGWGAASMGMQANGHFDPVEQQHSTNTKELLAVLYGLRSFASYFPNQHVLCMTDSVTAVSVAKNMGSMESLTHDTKAQQIWQFAFENGIWLSVTFIPGHLNF